MSSEQKPELSKTRLWAFRCILVIGIPALLFGSIEIGLRVFGYGYPTSFLIQDEHDKNYVRDNDRFAWRFFPKALARVPQPIRVPLTKPANTKRIIVFGGSAAMGDPEPAHGFPRVLERMLASQYPEWNFEVINAAMTAINSHVVLPIVKDCVPLDADLWIVYMGNNEVNGPFGSSTVFGIQTQPRSLIRASLAAKRLRLGQLLANLASRRNTGIPESWGGMEMFLQQQVAWGSPKLERVYKNLESNLTEIYQLGQRHGVPIITSTVAVNLTHSAPFVSLRDERLTAAQPEQWENHHTRGVDAAQAGDNESARTAFTQALKIDPGHAETQFRLGKLWGAPAIEHFSKARDLDALRFRADSRINDVIRKTATSAGDGIHFIDLAESLPGGELFHEHVHFTFMGNFSLARQFASVAAEVFGFKRDAPQITQDECARQLGLTFFHRHEITKNMRHRLNQPPFSTQMDCKERDQNLSKQITVLSLEMTPTAGQQSITSFEKLIAERPQDWLLRRQFALMLASMGKLDRAIDQWQAIIKQMPHDPVGHQQLGSLHNRLKQWDKAEPFLRQSIALREINPQAWNSLGICLSHGEKINESYDCFARAVEIMPKNGEALTNWGLVLANQDRVNDAQQKYKEATKADSKYVPAFQNLGQLLTKQGQFVKAEHAYKRVAELLPNDAVAHLNLALIFLRLKKTEQAIEELEISLKLNPNNPTARQYLSKLRG